MRNKGQSDYQAAAARRANAASKAKGNQEAERQKGLETARGRRDYRKDNEARSERGLPPSSYKYKAPKRKTTSDPTISNADADKTKRAADSAYTSAVRDRMRNKQHKGQYYGPDELKGNFSQIKKWRDAGKPPVQGWLKRQSGAG